MEVLFVKQAGQTSALLELSPDEVQKGQVLSLHTGGLFMHLMYGVASAWCSRPWGTGAALFSLAWLLKWTWHQLKAALSSKSFDKAYDNRYGVFFTGSAQFSGGACFILEREDRGVPFREIAMLNCLSLCKSAVPQHWVSGNCSQSCEPDNQSNSCSAVLVPFGMGSALWMNSHALPG